MKTRLSLLTLLLFVTTSAFAQQGERPERRMRDGEKPHMEQREPGERFEQMAKRLELTADQKAKIEALQVPHLKQMISFKNQLGEKHAQKKTMMSADKPDQGKINNLIDEISKIEASAEKETVNHQLAVRGLLTDKQKVKFDAMQHKMKNGKMKHRN